MTEIELKDLLAKWLPAKWKYSDGEIELMRRAAGKANPDAFDKQMAAIFESRDTTGKMAVSSILHALHEASRGAYQADIDGSATADHYAVAGECIKRVLAAHGSPKRKIDAYCWYLDECRRVGIDVPEHIAAKYQVEIQRLMDVVDKETLKVTAAGATA